MDKKPDLKTFKFDTKDYIELPDSSKTLSKEDKAIKKRCIFCDKVVSRKSKKFCNRICQIEYRKKEYEKILINRKFGKLVFLEIKSIYKASFQCECGKITVTTIRDVLKGHTKSCGCIQYEWKKLPPGIAAAHDVIRRYKKNAAERGYVWDLTVEQFLEITQKNCYYCGGGPSNLTRTRSKNYLFHYIYNGIDRVDNDKGYHIDNIVPCCIYCNSAKRDKSLIEFENWINQLISYRKKNEHDG